MKLFGIILALATLTIFTAANPLTSDEVAGEKHSSNPNDFKQYYLKTKVVKGTGPARFDGLYLYSYHTGAGLGDSALAKSKKNLPTAFLNGTYQQFNFNEGVQAYLPWGMYLALQVFYANWQPSQINTGTGDSGFFLNQTGLHHSSDSGFVGWMVCDWWHSVPQLFWKVYYETNYSLPSNCADVLLLPEYV